MKKVFLSEKDIKLIKESIDLNIEINAISISKKEKLIEILKHLNNH